MRLHTPSGAERQLAAHAAGESPVQPPTLHRLSIIRPGTVVSAELMAAVVAWRSARLQRGTLSVCAACGEHGIDPSEPVPAIALLLPFLAPIVEIAAVCSSCARSDDGSLFSRILGRLGGYELNPASLSARGSA